MKKYFIDTNIFLRTLIKEDEDSFEASRQLLRGIKTGKIRGTTASIVLAEIVWTLSSYYHFSKEKVLRTLRGIINLRGLKIIDNYQPSVSLKLFKNKSVKYIDSLIASIEPIYTRQWVIVSYDKDFDKLGVLRKKPEDLTQ